MGQNENKKNSLLKKATEFLSKLRGAVMNTYRLQEVASGLQKSGLHNGERFVHFLNVREGNRRICELLNKGEPAMISRHGGTEIKVATQYDWDYSIRSVPELCSHSGFFPNDGKLAEDWAELYVESSREIDCLCDFNHKWGRYAEVQHLFSKYSPKASIVNDLNVLVPFFQANPWTWYLKGKRVLVIHPFADTICSQYQKRELLFENPDVLPEFAKLETIKPIVNITGRPVPGLETWFHAYDDLKEQVSRCKFDIALLGCASYGLILAADIKKSGKQAIHMGGVLQLLFGIKGQRWDNEAWNAKGLFNKHWVRPSNSERPDNAGDLENAAYW